MLQICEILSGSWNSSADGAYKALPFIDKYFNLIALLFTILPAGGFVGVKYIF